MTMIQKCSILLLLVLASHVSGIAQPTPVDTLIIYPKVARNILDLDNTALSISYSIPGLSKWMLPALEDLFKVPEYSEYYDSYENYIDGQDLTDSLTPTAHNKQKIINKDSLALEEFNAYHFYFEFIPRRIGKDAIPASEFMMANHWIKLSSVPFEVLAPMNSERPYRITALRINDTSFEVRIDHLLFLKDAKKKKKSDKTPELPEATIAIKEQYKNCSSISSASLVTSSQDYGEVECISEKVSKVFAFQKTDLPISISEDIADGLPPDFKIVPIIIK
jgi:hypothetical protein